MADAQTVLIIDDNPYSRLFLQKVVINAGYKTVLAEDGYKAVDIAKTSKIDVIILDLGMPKIDGISTLKMIRAFEHRARVVVSSAFHQDAIQAEIEELDISFFVPKPVDVKALVNSVNMALAEIEDGI